MCSHQTNMTPDLTFLGERDEPGDLHAMCLGAVALSVDEAGADDYTAQTLFRSGDYIRVKGDAGLSGG